MVDHLSLPPPIRHTDRRQGGGGGATERRTPGRHGPALSRDLDAILDAEPIRIVDGVDPRRVFKIRGTTRLSDDDLRRRNLEFLGDTEDWTYFVVPTDEQAAELRRAVAEYSAGTAVDAPLASFFDRIDQLEPYGPDDRASASLLALIDSDAWPVVVDVSIWSSATDEEARRRVDDVRAACQQYGAAVLGADARARTAAVRARCDRAALEALLGLTVVESIRAPLAPLLEPSTWLNATIDDVRVDEPLEAIVGVLDDGVATGHPLLRDLVVADYVMPDGHPWPDAGPHGTLVAGLAAYGGFESAFEHGFVELPKPVRLACVRVLEPDGSGDPNSTHLPSAEPDHDVIEAAIRRLHGTHGVRVINLSVTDRFPYAGPHASVLTEMLDSLSRELDVLIVVAAGNRGFAADGTTNEGLHVLHNYPAYMLDEDARIAEPAVASIPLTVGSLGISDAPVRAAGTSHIDEHAVARRNRPSPFSRSGPGVTAHAKPEVSHFGGDLVWAGTHLIPNDLGVGAVSLNHEFGNRLFRVSSGTSFAAPRLANLAARILDRYPGASANLIRALIGVTSSVPPEVPHLELEADDLIRVVGNGIPDSEAATDSSANRVLMTFEGTVETDAIAIHPVPVPEEFVRGRADRWISIALAFDPPVRRQRREYLAGRIKLDLFRNFSVDEIRGVMGRQDPDDRNDIPNDRRRIQDRLRPTATLLNGSTLQVRRWSAPAGTSLNPDDGDTYHVVLSHVREPWAGRLPERYDNQTYALVVELWDRDRPEIDLYNLVQNRVAVPAQVRVRA